MQTETNEQVLSFLQALGVSQKEHEIDGKKGTFYELNSAQVAELTEKIGSLIAVAMLIRDIFVAGAGQYQDLFASAQSKLSQEAQETLFRLIAFSLRSSEESVRQIAPRHLPALLVAIYETNRDFFDLFSETSKIRQDLAKRIPGLDAALRKLTADGPPPSPASVEADGALTKSA